MHTNPLGLVIRTPQEVYQRRLQKRTDLIQGDGCAHGHGHLGRGL